MQYAIFSDVHNDPEALGAVLLDAARRNVDTCIRLGDTGTDPAVNLLRTNHVEAVFGNWEISGWRHLSAENQKWTLALPPLRKYPGFWVSHAAPLCPNHISSLQKFLKNRGKLSAAAMFPYYHIESDALWKGLATLLEAKTPVFFHGHTHQQGLWVFTPDNHLSQHAPRSQQIDPQTVTVIGVGSAGQPKDSLRPSYVVYDSETHFVEFVRL